MKVKKFLKEQAQKDLKSLETESDREMLQRLKNNEFSVPMNDYLFQVLIEGGNGTEFVYVSAPNLNEAQKRFTEKMEKDNYKAGEYCLICIYRKIK